MLFQRSITRLVPLLGVLALGTVFVAPQAVFAQDATWAWGGADQDWDNPANWSGGVVPVIDADGDSEHAFINTATDGEFPVISATLAGGTPQDIFVGTGAGTAGRLDQTAGTAGTGATNWAFIGQDGGTGTLNVADTSGTGGSTTGFAQGSGTFSAGRLLVGAGTDANGTVNVNTSGTVDVNGELWVGHETGSVGTMNLDNGTVNTSTWAVIGRGDGSVGTLNMTGGTIKSALTDAASFFVVGAFGGSTGIANVSGGTIDTSAGAGAYIGEGGNGTFDLSGTATLSAGSGALRIGLNDGAIGGTSIIGDTVTVNIGDLTLGLNGDGLDTTAVGTLSFVANATGISTIIASGDVNLSSSDGDFLSVDLSSYAGSHADILLIDGVTSQGEFTDLAQGASVSTGFAQPYAIDYSVAGDVWLRAIPEPASIALLGFAGLCLLGGRRR